MIAMRRAALAMLIACLACTLVGCGQMGPLSLPEDAPTGDEDENGDDDDER